MTDLDQLWLQVPTGAAPTAEIVATGRGVRRRRRVVVGSVLLTAALVVGVGLVSRGPAPGGAAPVTRPGVSATPALPATVAPPGMRLVGSGRVVVAVPRQWVTDAHGVTRSCVQCLGGIRAVVRFGPAQDVLPGTPIRSLGGISHVDGFAVIRPHFECEQLLQAPCGDARTVPSLGVAVNVRTNGDRDVPEQILSTLRILPASYTTVPVLVRTPDRGVQLPGPIYQATLRAARLRLALVGPPLVLGQRIVVDPPVGQVVRSGSTVRVTGVPSPIVPSAGPALLPTSTISVGPAGSEGRGDHESGVLELGADRCVVLRGAPTPVWWPSGWTADVMAGRLRLLDDQGRVVARDGDRVSVSGGVEADDVVTARRCAPVGGFSVDLPPMVTPSH